MLSVFDEGDNLSFRDCGEWDQKEMPPWSAKIFGIQGNRHCYGILISKNYILTRKFAVFNISPRGHLIPSYNIS